MEAVYKILKDIDNTLNNKFCKLKINNKMIMETLNFAEQKISLAQTILALNDINKMYQIQSYINKILERTQEVEDDFNAKKLSFSEWNKQFDDNRDLNTFLPEYGMKLRDFRFKIYNSERQEGVSKEDFISRVNNWK